MAARRLRISGVVTTFMTGTLTTAAIQLAAKESGDLESEEQGSPSLLVTMLAVYVLAAAVGAGLSMARVTAVAIIPFLIVGGRRGSLVGGAVDQENRPG